MGSILQILEEVLTLIPKEYIADLPENQYSKKPFDSFEYAIWNNGEKIRQVLLSNKNYTFTKAEQDIIISIIEDVKAKRGRQPFVMLLAKVKYKHLAPEIIHFIKDSDIRLQVAHTICKMRVPGYETELYAFLNQFKPSGSDKRLILKYLENTQLK